MSNSVTSLLGHLVSCDSKKFPLELELARQVPPSNEIFPCLRQKFNLVDNAYHTAPEWCQPEKSATLSFSAFLVICDQDKKLQVGQQIL